MPTPFETQVLEDLTELKTNMKSLIGNGQPGRISKIESRVNWIEKFSNRIVGALILLNVLGIGGIAALLKYYR